MRRTILFLLSFLVVLICSYSHALSTEITIFGPKQYLRTSGAPDSYSDSFSGVSGEGRIIIKNGNYDGERRVEDGVSSATVSVNGVELFGPNDFNQNVYILESAVDILEENTISVVLSSVPDSYITIEIMGQPNTPTANLVANPPTIIVEDSTSLVWETTYADSVIIEPDVGSVDTNGSITISPTQTTTYTITATGAGGTATDIVTVDVIQLPTASISVDPSIILAGESAALSWNTSNADTVTIDQGIGSVDVNGSVSVSPTVTRTYTIIAIGPGGTATDSVQVVVETIFGPPVVNLEPASITIDQTGSTTLSWTASGANVAYIDNGVGSVPTTGVITVSPEHTTIYTLTVSGPYGSASAQAEVHVVADIEPQSEGSFGEAYNELIPEDATVAYYEERRFTLVVGEVVDLAGQPIENVRVSLLHHPEYGSVTTDSQGRFALPVEGGGVLTVVYQKQGLLTAHRQVKAPWNDFVNAETVALLAEDVAATTVTFDGNPDTVVTHHSTPITDVSGTRSTTLVFTGDNRAYLTDENGNDVQELSTITTRATEYVTPESMPAKLPPTSGFTYCAELSVDGAQRVRFEKPVVMWVDNFLGFEVGEVVPVGSFNRDRGVWIPEENGTVVKLLDLNADRVVDALDATGDDQADDLDGDGELADEVEGLGDPAVYIAGDTYWRAVVSHFTPWDCNWPYGPPPGSGGPNPYGPPYADDQDEDDCEDCISSYVEARSRIFHEDIPIPGTDLNLHYASNRVSGYQQVISIPVSGATVPDSLKEIIVRCWIAGRSLQKTLLPLPNQQTEIVWDGRDYRGSKVTSPIYALIDIGFVYEAVYYSSSAAFARAFAQVGGSPTAVQARQEVILWKHDSILVSPPDAIDPEGTIASGWSISSHNRLNTADLTNLHKGDGTKIQDNIPIIMREYAYYGNSSSLAIDPKGNLFIADSNYNRIKKMDTNGTITTIAGGGMMPITEDGIPATEALLYQPRCVALDSQGNLFISESYRILKVDSNGIITIVIDIDDDRCILQYPSSLAIDSQDNLFIADTENHRILKMDTIGIITTVVEDNVYTCRLSSPSGLAFDSQENLFIADTGYHRILKVDKSGIITTVAGTALAGYSGDGGPAIQARLSSPRGLALDSQGNLFIGDTWNNRIRKVDTNGIITTFAGNGEEGFSGDGGPATQARLDWPSGVAVDPKGNLFIADSGNKYIRRVGPPKRSAISVDMNSDDVAFADPNSMGYIVNSAGKHYKTIDLETGKTLYTFIYEVVGDQQYLTAIDDRFGNRISITRDGSGVPMAITSADGITTTLTIDANHHLTQIGYPDGATFHFEYTEGGLMTAETEPNGNRFVHQFDELGRLTHATDDEGGHWQYTRTTHENGDILTEVLTGEGNLTTYLDNTKSTGAYTSTITDPTGAQTLFNRSSDGLTTSKSLPCGMDLEFKYDLDPKYKFKVVKEKKITTPADLERVTLKGKTYKDTNFDGISDLISETITINDKTTSIENNVLQAQETATSPEGRTVTLNYNPTNLLTESTSIPGLFDTAYEYDNRGRLTSILTNARQISFTYDSEGNLETATDPLGYTTSYGYDAVGRVTAVHRPDASDLFFTYDDNGNMTILTNPSLVDHGFGFNSVNLPDSYQTPISGSYAYLYDADRRLVETRFPSGKITFNVYDKTRLIQTQTPDGNIDYTYLCGTKIESITKGSQFIAYGYDGKLVTSETLSGTLNHSLTYGYNNDFDVVDFTYAGDSVSYGYDNDGLLTSAGAYTISRNAGNGLPEAVTGGSLDISRVFNGYGELDSQSTTIAGNSVMQWTLVRDNSGRITGKTETIDGASTSYIYSYDSMGHLLTVTKDGSVVESYDYNANGTRITETNLLRGITDRNLSYSDEDHLLTASSATYHYDLDGFLTSKTDGSDVTTYHYSLLGELLQVDLPDGRVVSYEYDPLGRRIAKLIDGTIVEKYLWQGITRLLAVYDGSDSLIQRFEYADDRMPVTMIQSGLTYYLAYDQVGSLRAVTDGSGNLVKRIDYDSFGNILSDTNSTFAIPFGFAGGLHDRDTGLVRFGYREYDPDTGRWTAKDPIGFAGGDTDLFGYVQNDPVNWVDPYGLSKWHPVPGKKGWEVRRDKPLNPDIDYYHEHYRYKGKDIPRKVNPETKEQKKHGEGKCDGSDIDVPEDVIDAAKKGFSLTGNIGIDLTILEGLESFVDTLEQIDSYIPEVPVIPIPGAAPVPIYAIP